MNRPEPEGEGAVGLSSGYSWAYMYLGLHVYLAEVRELGDAVHGLLLEVCNGSGHTRERAMRCGER